MRIVIVGLGGIGSILSEKLSRYLKHLQDEEFDMVFIDGDDYETKNLVRQEFATYGNKAEVKAAEIFNKFEIPVKAYPHFLNGDNIEALIKENDIVMLCVDNHKTRRSVSYYCSMLDNITLISGGNDYTDGNVQIYVRKNGQDITADLTTYHPEIKEAKDKSPEEMSCEELEKSEPQLYFTNLTVAAIMCWVFYNIITRKEIVFGEVYFDITTMSVSSRTREPKKGE
jgi:molybdopterin/thiamine biosynthesis adenylyltransferase